MAEDTTLQYNFPYESFKNFAVAYTTGSYGVANTTINLATASETGNFPSNLPFNLTWANVTDYPSLYEDPNIEIVKVTGRHTSGFYVTRAQEGTSGSIKTGTKNHILIQSPYASLYEDKWKYLNNPDNTVYLFDDFDWGSTSSTVLGWTTAGGSFSASAASTSKRIGSMILQETASLTGWALMRLNDKLFRLDSGPITYKMAWAPSINANEGGSFGFSDYRWGLGDSTTFGYPTNGLFWRRVSGSTYIGSANNSTINEVLTDIPTGLITTTNGPSLYGEYKIIVENSGLARFYLNNVEVSGSPLTTNIPYGSGQEMGAFANVNEISGSSNNIFRYNLDYFEVYQDFTGQRTQPLLMTSMVSYWPLWETGGAAYDSHGSNHLTGISLAPTGVGDVILLSGRNFNGTQALWTENSNVSLSGSGIGLSVFGWFKTNYTGSVDTAHLVAAYDTTNDTRQWRAYILNQKVSFSNSYDGTTTSITATSTNTYNTGQWNFFCCVYDNSINKAQVRLNDTYSDLTTMTGIYSDVTSPLAIGAIKRLGVSALLNTFSGQLSEIGVVSRALTSGEQNFLYNNSGGMTYPFNHFDER